MKEEISLIKLIRIDERLVHGQVAVVWTKYLGVNRVVVADDDAARNDTQKTAMKMAMPQDTKLMVATVDKAISILKDPRANSLNIFVVVKNPENAKRITDAVAEAKEVNVGNYGRMSGGDESSKITLERNLFVTKQQAAVFSDIAKSGVHVFYQITPQEKATDIEELISRKVR